MANPPSKPTSPSNPRNIRPSAQAKGSSAGSAKQQATVKSEPSSATSDMEAEAELLKSVGSVIVRNEFYRDGYRSILRIAIIEALIILALVAAMFFIIEVHQPENRYFATTEDGRLIPAMALSEPNLSVPALMSWSAQAATEVMTFGFNDYKRRLQEASRNFTRSGWASFTKALEKSRIIEMVEANRQVVSATPSSAPILVSEYVLNGTYQWEVDVPLVITYQSGSNVRSDRLLVKLIISRVPKLESPNGVAIEQWLAQ
ncbi:MAG TPA: type IVB secretion system apparatus protein IcmL/DotI [Alphaproteobacteria bacterium]|nr:type IVB secretion system apparatus protein IcmL/DotI [Alphaproteobacteria bacterium]